MVNFRKDQKNGYGKTYFVNGGRFEINYLNDIPYGIGKYFYADGDIFIGGYKQKGDGSKRDGEGTYYYRDGKQFTALWDKGEIWRTTVLFSEAGEILDESWNQLKLSLIHI